MHADVLTHDQVAHYEQHGFVIVPDLLSARECEAFIRSEREPKPPERRLGLRTHTVDPDWAHLAMHPRVAGGAAQLSGGPTRIVQTMYLAKKPAAPDASTNPDGRGIALHQDSHYLPTEPNTLMACWLALNDTDADNGGFCVVPDSHKDGLRSTHPNRDDDHVSWEHESEMRDRSGRAWMQRMYSFQIDDLNDSDIVRLTIPRGAGVFFSGMVIHGSFANLSPTRWRHAFAVHYVHESTWVLRCDVQDTVPAQTASAG